MVRDAAALYVAGVVFGNIPFHVTWYVWDRRRPGGGPEEATEEAMRRWRRRRGPEAQNTKSKLRTPDKNMRNKKYSIIIDII